MGIGRLSWITIEKYAERMKISDFDIFARCMKAMDDVFIQHHSPETEKKEFSRDMFRGAFNSK